MRTHVFCEHLRENKKLRETVFACSYGAQVEYFKQKNGQQSRDTVSLTKDRQIPPMYPLSRDRPLFYALIQGFFWACVYQIRTSSLLPFQLS